MAVRTVFARTPIRRVPTRIACSSCFLAPQVQGPAPRHLHDPGLRFSPAKAIGAVCFDPWRVVVKSDECSFELESFLAAVPSDSHDIGDRPW